MHHSMARQPNLGGQNLRQVHLNLVQLRKDGNLQTFQNYPRQTYQLLLQNPQSIPTQSKVPSPVVMSAKSAEKSYWKPQTRLEEEPFQLTQIGMNPLDFMPIIAQNPVDSFPFSYSNLLSIQVGKPKRRGPLQS
jgi:hypothetical protein